MERAVPVAATPLLLVTGFLGSGKTTLINRLLALPPPPRLGVVVNEFGQIGIDGALLAASSGDGSGIMELANGCVCCVRGTELWESALELCDRANAQALIVETSGLVEPRAVLEQYRLLPPPLAKRIDLRGLLCVVDALHAREFTTLRAEAVQQIQLADRLLLTKLDLASDNDLASTHRLLDELSASTERASLLPAASDAEVANVLRWLFERRPNRVEVAQNRAPESDSACHEGEPGHEHRHAGRQLSAVSLYEPGLLLAGPLLQLLADLRGQVLRVKGIVRVLGASFAQSNEPVSAALHLSGRRVELQPLKASAEVSAEAAPNVSKDASATGSTLVFIGEDLDENWLRLRLSACRTSRMTGASNSSASGSSNQSLLTAHGAP